MSTPITRHDFPEIRWRGHWIWAPEEPATLSGFWSAEVRPHARESHGLFRKTFQIDRVPERAPARLTADSRYALFVNGQPVSRGPLRSQPRRLHYDMVDLAPYLAAGENVLAIYVKYYGMPTSFWMPATPNNTLGTSGILVFECDLGAAGWIVSDASWKATKAEAWADTGRDGTDHGDGVPVEVFDARRLPYDWQQLQFDDSAWGSAQRVAAMHIGGFARTQPPTDPYGPLYPRPIASLSGELKTPMDIRLETLERQLSDSIGGPIARVQAAIDLPAAVVPSTGLPLTFDIPAGGMARICFDMGVVVSGLVAFDVDAAAGTLLDLSFTEVALALPVSMDKSRAGTRYITRGHHDRFQTFDSNGFRYAYVLVSGAVGTVTLRHFAVQEELYPWQAGASFTCSDAELNRIFQAGVRTVQLCSHDALIDCPTREQRSWVGDAVVHQMVHLATNLDWRLAWHYLTVTNSPRSDGILPMAVVGNLEASGIYTIPDWSLHWIHGVFNCYRFGGDCEVVAALLPTVERILRWYTPYQTSSGVLKDVPEWNLVDWSSVSTEDTSAVLTALWARGLREFAEMAAWLGDRGRQCWAERVYGRIVSGFEVFWDAERGSYIDHVVNGERRPEMSQLAGALAIIAGLAPTERWARIVETITDAERLVVRSWLSNGAGEQSMEKWQRQVREGRYDIDWDVERQIVLAEPFMSYVVHDAVALAGQADRLPELYRRWSQFLVDGYNTIGECWDFGTHAHGWSCTPTRDMVFYTLGVTPAEPGYAKARIAPRLGRLAWAKGSVPTPHGLITVAASADAVIVDSPVPVVVEIEGQSPRILPAGRHELPVH
ncbi:MAG: alpha-L-rhamnosidase N-terminal domain-containing protein [Kouleothrix sp.]|nr:alpha-L-rhamnosidase N-terminal domain-containing protein [Kouleothrix sp.]